MQRRPVRTDALGYVINPSDRLRGRTRLIGADVSSMSLDTYAVHIGHSARGPAERGQDRAPGMILMRAF